MAITDMLIRIAVAFVVCSAIGLPSYRIRVVSLSGLLAGYVMGIGIIFFGGWAAFVIILMFFLLSGITTKYHYDQKKKRGLAEKKGGARGYKNVFGNGIVSLAMIILFHYFGCEWLIAAYLGSAAAATCDTAGGEIGRLSRSDPRLITNLKKVPAGTEGAVSSLGKGAEIAIGALLGLIAWFAGMPTETFAGMEMVAVTVFGGFMGATVDSFLGATLETTQNWFGNNMTNFLCTIAGAVFSILLYSAL
ncbi:MAG TPA: DUF92 domain-containing protein [Candidatus Methanofastidiosa archaeon]|nr:DUF92 domain-containing protein [Candidatus Methanofastidiosa archaeon]HPR41879.1 DUF92 domain-containing protein [Candidatus Methanofastidiosa archaeon]